MKPVGHFYGGADVQRRFPVAVTIANAGIPSIVVTDAVGIRPATTTSFADTMGLITDTATYSTTQADLDDVGSDLSVGVTPPTITGLDMGRVVSVSVRPDLIVEALASGGATESTALTLLVNTSASSAGTTITDADVGTADMAGGLIWCTKGANAGLARPIITLNSATSIVTTVPFPRTIAVNDEFLFVPWNAYGTGASAMDGISHVQASTLFTQANAAIASGTGGRVKVVEVVCAGRSDTKVRFLFGDHQYGYANVVA